jgi:hypothetical protein
MEREMLPQKVLDKTIGFFDEPGEWFPRRWGWGTKITEHREVYEVAIPLGTILRFPNGTKAYVRQDLIRNLCGHIIHQDFYDGVEAEGGKSIWGTLYWDLQVVQFPADRKRTVYKQNGSPLGIVALTRPLTDEERAQKKALFYGHLTRASKILDVGIKEAIRRNKKLGELEWVYADNPRQASQVIQTNAGQHINAAIMSCHGLCNLTDPELVRLIDVTEKAFHKFKVLSEHFEWASIFFGYGGGYRGIPYRIETLGTYITDQRLREEQVKRAQALQEKK